MGAKTCEMPNCKEKVFVTAFPERIPVKLCQKHFLEKMGHLISPDTPIIDKTTRRRSN